MLLVLQNLSSVSVPADSGSAAGAGPELPGASSGGRCGTRTGSGAGRLSPAFPAANSPSEPPGPRAGRIGAGSDTGLVRGRRAQPGLCCGAPLPQSHCRSQNRPCKCVYRSLYMMGCLGLRGWGFFVF